MDAASRFAAGLKRLDVVIEEFEDGALAFDHLPVVVDLRLEKSGSQHAGD